MRFLPHVPATPPIYRNLALRAYGAEIIPTWTSQTHKRGSSGQWKSWVQPWSKAHNAHPLGPETLLQRDIIIGQCWEITGSAGHFAIALPAPAKVFNITLFYPSQSVLSPIAIQQAPRDVAVYGVVLRNLLDDIFPEGSGFSEGKLFLKSPHPNITFFPLAHINFTIPLTEADRQDIPLSPVMSLDRLVVTINSNWGADTTCIYPVGVHGEDSHLA